MDREINKQHEEILRGIKAQLTELCGNEWGFTVRSFGPNTTDTHFIGALKDVREIPLAINVNRDEVSAMGLWPRQGTTALSYKPAAPQSRKIYMTAKKSPKQLGADIFRRLLTVFAPELVEARKIQAKFEEVEAGAQRALREMADALKLPPSARPSSKADQCALCFSTPRAYGDIRTNSGDSVDLTLLSVPLASALRIAGGRRADTCRGLNG